MFFEENSSLMCFFTLRYPTHILCEAGYLLDIVIPVCVLNPTTYLSKFNYLYLLFLDYLLT